MKSLLCFLIVCTPPTIPGATQQANGMHRAGKFWKKGISYTELTKEEAEALQRDPAFDIKPISKEEFEEHHQTPEESDAEKIQRLLYENTTAMNFISTTKESLEKILAENRELKDRLAVLEQRTHGL